MKKQAEVVVFACNWDGLSCVEAAAHEGLCYPASVKVVRVSCLSRVHMGLMFKAFEVGAAGVMLLGCKPDHCHYDIENQCISKEFEKAQKIMRLLGLCPGRLIMAHMSRGDGAGFVERITSLVTEMRSL